MYPPFPQRQKQNECKRHILFNTHMQCLELLMCVIQRAHCYCPLCIQGGCGRHAVVQGRRVGWGVGGRQVGMQTHASCTAAAQQLWPAAASAGFGACWALGRVLPATATATA